MTSLTRIFLLLLGLHFTTGLLAQSNNVVLINDSVYLGRLPFQNAIKHNFEFEVKSGRQAQIKDVKTDCACNLVSYPEFVLRGGQKGVVTIEFDPYKPGPFEKHFQVTWEGGNDVTELVLKGYIEPNIVPLNVDFIESWGALKLKSKVVTFGSIPNHDVVKRKVEVYNPSPVTISFEDSIIAPSYLEVVWKEKEIAPLGKTEFEVFLNPELKKTFGFSLDHMVFLTNHPTFPKLELNVSSNIYAGEKTVKKQPKKVALPKIWVSSDTLDLGKVFSKNSFLLSFAVYNRGAGELSIRSIIPDENCEIIDVDKRDLKEDEYANIKVKVSDLFKNAGMQYRTIRVMSNDPENEEKTLIIKANVIK